MGKAATTTTARRASAPKKSVTKSKADKTRLSRKALAQFVLQRPAAGESTKVLQADLERLRPHLGRHCPHFGKKGVVQLAAPSKKASKVGSSATGPPRFNKYAGWVEWKNVIFLWVNAVGGSFTNSFTRAGRQVNWYVGGANPTEKSPIVRRLIAAECGEASERNTRILLFVRRLSTEPYVYCGDCKCLSHDSKKKGFEFTWELRDHAKLSSAPAFQRLLGSQKGGSTAKQAAALRWA
eukprot:gnl/TRDRNA2_/TRDRNA2_42981_c0_seq1.p1 gnl/TRDRNA2_/TRDRNA2_42981_c0~~gnl/TRDRNA2_/TRDRNA2_42981_c0_seq1.p1  ORF type:complete len:262 (+),score=48.44 gnl/TRDRNA2_/TRDRNA2_42981_c0_seq1:75-788(+)